MNILKKMAQRKTYRINDITIGSKVYLVHTHYAFEKKAGGKVLPDQINLVKLGSKAELKTAANSVAKVDTKDKQLTNLLNK